MGEKRQVILIVDDEPDMCWALEHVLRKCGVLSRKALTGQEALALTKSGHFALAFVDAKLPDMDGLELARRIREVNPAIRIVMISGYFYREDADVRDALSEGLISGFVSKPFLHVEIRDAIQTARS